MSSPKPTFTHTPGSGRPSLGLQHQISQAAKGTDAKTGPAVTQTHAFTQSLGFTGSIPPGATIHVVNGVITGHS